jgi:hypothetical protein
LPTQRNIYSLTNLLPASQTLNINAANNNFNPHYSPLIANHNLPSFLNNSDTLPTAKQLLPNQTLVFTSQPTNVDPPRLLPLNNNKTRGTHKNVKSVRIKPISQTDPQPNQPRPDKKTKNFDPPNNPFLNPKTIKPTQEAVEEMEVQGEKKRRREDAVSTKNDSIDVSQHFLTAGPGSQDCRD